MHFSIDSGTVVQFSSDYDVSTLVHFGALTHFISGYGTQVSL